VCAQACVLNGGMTMPPSANPLESSRNKERKSNLVPSPTMARRQSKKDQVEGMWRGRGEGGGMRERWLWWRR
jgi:hypothetical protein